MCTKNITCISLASLALSKELFLEGQQELVYGQGNVKEFLSLS